NKGKVLGNLGMMYARQGDKEGAAEAYEQALAIFRDLGETGFEKDIARQLSKVQLKKGGFLDALGSYREGLEDGEEASGAQKMARKLFRLFGRLSGPVPGDEEEEGDVIDVSPESD
ncbi:MAG: tetratricopeptide repeat protein, partial [Anaerolineae bacterium]|nr:tetratricopeptide repeat protein [Anaerolineae bacterium]